MKVLREIFQILEVIPLKTCFKFQVQEAKRKKHFIAFYCGKTKLIKTMVKVKFDCIIPDKSIYLIQIDSK